MTCFGRFSVVESRPGFDSRRLSCSPFPLLSFLCIPERPCLNLINLNRCPVHRSAPLHAARRLLEIAGNADHSNLLYGAAVAEPVCAMATHHIANCDYSLRSSASGSMFAWKWPRCNDLKFLGLLSFQDRTKSRKMKPDMLMNSATDPLCL